MKITGLKFNTSLARVFLLWLGGPVGTLAAAADKSPVAIFDGAYLLQVLGSLLFVLACLFGLVFLSKKFNGIPTGSKRAIQVLSSVKLGTKEKIVLLRAGEQHLLVGVAAGNVRTLHTFDTPVDGFEGAGVEFASLLESSVPAGGLR